MRLNTSILLRSEERKAQVKEEDRKEKLGALEDARLMKQYLEFEAHETVSNIQ